jgi:hypothetical protein
MAIIAGMDLGYGSQVKIVRTNYLLAGTHVNGTAQAYANLLNMYNDVQTQAGATDCVADYIIPCNDNGTGAGAELDPTSGIDPRVIHAATATTNFPVLGPVDEALADETTNSYPDAADTAAEVGRNYKILAVLNVGVMDFGATFVAGAAIDLLGGVSGNAQQMFGHLMVSQVAGNASVLDFTEVLADVTAAGVLNGVAVLEMTDTRFTSGYVQKGNAAGTTASAFAGSTGTGFILADTCALISVLSLVRNA